MCEISEWIFAAKTKIYFMLFTKLSNKNADKQRPMEQHIKVSIKLMFLQYIFVVYLCWIIVFVLCAYIYHQIDL